MALTFFWTCESTTFDSADDYSAGDNTPTATGSPTISSAQSFAGANSILTNTGNYYTFDSAGIIDVAEGAVGLSFYMTTWGEGNFTAAQDSLQIAHHIRMEISGASGSGGLGLEIRNAGSGRTDILTGDIGLSANTWYSAIMRWDSANTSGKIEVYNSSGGLIDSVENTGVTSGHFPPTSIDSLLIGLFGGTGVTTHIDNVMVADSYNEPLQDNFGIASYQNYGAITPPQYRRRHIGFHYG